MRLVVIHREAVDVEHDQEAVARRAGDHLVDELEVREAEEVGVLIRVDVGLRHDEGRVDEVRDREREAHGVERVVLEELQEVVEWLVAEAAEHAVL